MTRGGKAGARAASGPVSKKGQERVEAILDAATRLLSEQGASALTMRAVAAEVGIRLGNLQYYFETREALVRELLGRILSTAATRVETQLARVGDSAEAPRVLFGALLKEQEDRVTCQLFYELWALAAREPEVARELTTFYARYRDAVAEMLRRVLPEPERGRARVRAEVFIGLLEGMSLFRSGTAGKRSRDVDALLREVATWLTCGGPPPGARGESTGEG
ncbi:TetR/AcrR family transcriptional regulator [Myxococcaceae bacterium GXIMD 01537]